MRILILGSSGMIGHTMLRILSENLSWEIFGAVRAQTYDDKDNKNSKVFCGVDLTNQDNILNLLNYILPDIVVNCAGLTKHLLGDNDQLPALKINAMFPHILYKYCSLINARLIHVSTDCVFSGNKGNYSEKDATDAVDLYGKTKSLGEVTAGYALTVRTSTIGHEKFTAFGLLDWFLSQRHCKGFKNAIFSGLPTVEFSKIIRDIIIPNPSLKGLYHVGASPINKFELLKLIALSYNKQVEIVSDESFRIDRSLNVEKFLKDTGYRAPSWPHLVRIMHQDYLLNR